jgi:hypothetical protein
MKRKQTLLDNWRMAPQHKVDKAWGPDCVTAADNLRPTPSPLRATPQGRLRYSSPVLLVPSAAMQRARADIYGPEIVRSFQYPGNGAYKRAVTDSHKKALRAQRKAFLGIADHSAHQAAYTRALEETLVLVASTK